MGAASAGKLRSALHRQPLPTRAVQSHLPPVAPHPTQPAGKGGIPPGARLGACLALGSSRQGALDWDPWTVVFSQVVAALGPGAQRPSLHTAGGSRWYFLPRARRVAPMPEGVEALSVGTQGSQFQPSCAGTPGLGSFDCYCGRSTHPCCATPNTHPIRAHPRPACPRPQFNTKAQNGVCSNEVRTVRGRAGMAQPSPP